MPSAFTFRNSVFCRHCTHVFCIDLRTNSDYFSMSNSLMSFYNRGRQCLLRGTDWVFKSDRYNFVLNMFRRLTKKYLVVIALLLGQNVLIIKNTKLLHVSDFTLPSSGSKLIDVVITNIHPGWKIRFSNPGTDKGFISSTNCQDRLRRGG